MSEVFLTRDEIEHPYANLAVMLEDKRKKMVKMRKTVFAQITQSPEVLAPLLVYHGTTFLGEEFYWSIICKKSFKKRPRAIDATVKKLKEVEN